MKKLKLQWHPVLQLWLCPKIMQQTRLQNIAVVFLNAFTSSIGWYRFRGWAQIVADSLGTEPYLVAESLRECRGANFELRKLRQRTSGNGFGQVVAMNLL